MVIPSSCGLVLPECGAFLFCSDFIDYIKRGFEAIKDIYSPYQFKLHILASLCCVIVPLNSLHDANSFSLAHEGSRWQRCGNTCFVPSCADVECRLSLLSKA